MMNHRNPVPETGLVVWVSEDQKKVCVGLKGNLALVSIELTPGQAEYAIGLFEAALRIVRKQSKD